MEFLLGWALPTEAIISLSIVFLAVEMWVATKMVGEHLQTATAFTVPYIIGGVAAFWTIKRLVNSVSVV